MQSPAQIGLKEMPAPTSPNRRQGGLRPTSPHWPSWSPALPGFFHQVLSAHHTEQTSCVFCDQGPWASSLERVTATCEQQCFGIVSGGDSAVSHARRLAPSATTTLSLGHRVELQE